MVNSEQLADGVTTEIDSITAASVGDGYASASSGPTDIPGYTSTLLIHKVIGNTYIITHLIYNYGICLCTSISKLSCLLVAFRIFDKDVN